MYVSFKIPGEDRVGHVQQLLDTLQGVEYAVCFPPIEDRQGVPTLHGQLNFLGDVIDGVRVADYLDLGGREFLITRVAT